MLNPINKQTKTILDESLKEIEKLFDSDVISLTGIMDGVIRELLLHVIEDLKKESESKVLSIILTTTGGDALEVERMVNIIRKHYLTVKFIIPDYAYSAGTIFCMSGDNIYMDYYSVLGPIDPQVRKKDGAYVPALGYIDKFEEFIEKDREGKLTKAEYSLLANQDLAELRLYEQARDLTVDLLKNWLVTYKFKNWTKTKSRGEIVTKELKAERAEKIAKALGESGRWKSHGRGLSMETLQNIGLIIDDFSEIDKNGIIREYYNYLSDYMRINQYGGFIHSRRFF